MLRALPGLHPGCPLCPVVTQGEAALILALGASRRGHGLLAPPVGAYQAMSLLIGLACASKRAGVTLTHELRA